MKDIVFYLFATAYLYFCWNYWTANISKYNQRLDFVCENSGVTANNCGLKSRYRRAEKEEFFTNSFVFFWVFIFLIFFAINNSKYSFLKNVVVVAVLQATYLCYLLQIKLASIEVDYQKIMDFKFWLQSHENYIKNNSDLRNQLAEAEQEIRFLRGDLEKAQNKMS